VDDAVRLVLAALNNIDTAEGKVLSMKMKSAQMSDILRVWTENKGGKWERMEGRPGERIDEYLIGEAELPFTRELMIDNISHYLISFNDKVNDPVEFGLSSANTDKLSDEEILSLIENPPVEELN
jgi:FlaA1/EpsC-like NDP-sugar epimerase